MAFIILFIALIVERFFDCSHLRHWSWLFNLKSQLINLCHIEHPSVMIAIIILPLLVLVYFISFVLDQLLFGIFNFIFQIVLVLYCFGPRNLWGDAYRVMSDLDKNEVSIILSDLKTLFHVQTQSKTFNALRKRYLHQFFIEINDRIFAILIYYLIFGVSGIVFYRVIKIFAKENHSIFSNLANRIGALFDWFPIRILAFLFALGGQFMQVFQVWRKYLFLGFSTNEAMITECGFSAIEAEKMDPNKNVEKNALSLFDRSLIIFMVLIGIWGGSILF